MTFDMSNLIITISHISLGIITPTIIAFISIIVFAYLTNTETNKRLTALFPLALLLPNLGLNVMQDALGVLVMIALGAIYAITLILPEGFSEYEIEREVKA